MKNEEISLNDITCEKIERDRDDKRKSINKRKWSSVNRIVGRNRGRRRGRGRGRGRARKSKLSRISVIKNEEEELSDNMDVKEDINVVPEDKGHEETKANVNTTNNNKSKLNTIENEEMKFNITNENFILNVIRIIYIYLIMYV